MASMAAQTLGLSLAFQAQFPTLAHPRNEPSRAAGGSPAGPRPDRQGPCMLLLVHPCEVGARRTEFILETLNIHRLKGGGLRFD